MKMADDLINQLIVYVHTIGAIETTQDRSGAREVTGITRVFPFFDIHLVQN